MSESDEKKYVTTEAECRAAIRGVCPGCGGELTPIETTDNAKRPTFWSGCLKCFTYDRGVPRVIFETARFLVENNYIIPYNHLRRDEYTDSPERIEYWLSRQTAGLSQVVLKVVARHSPAPPTVTMGEIRLMLRAGETSEDTIVEPSPEYVADFLRSLGVEVKE